MMSANRLAGFLAALSISIWVPALKAQAQAQPATIALTPYLGVLWSFEAELDGQRGVYLFDTAGGITAITPETAVKAGCTPWGQITGFRMRGDRVDLKRCEDIALGFNGVVLSASTVGVLDFSTLLPKDAPPLAGSVALDSFAGQVVTIDLSRSQIVLETQESLRQRVVGATEVELRLGREIAGLGLTPFVAVQSERGKLWMELDTGSNSSIIVASHNAALFAMDGDDAAAQVFRGSLVGNVALTADDARSMPLVIDGNIGAKTLKNWIVTLDFLRGRAWVSPAAVR